MEETVTQPLKKGYKTIRIPMTESEYEQFPDNPGYARRYIDEIYGCHPELFPAGFEAKATGIKVACLTV